MTYPPGDPNQPIDLNKQHDQPSYGPPPGQPNYGPPQDPYQQQYPNPYQQQPPYGGYFVAPDHPQTGTILVLGILGLVFCQFCAPFAWVMGKKALNEIDSSGGTIGGRSQINAGYICGIIGSIILIAYVLFFAVFLTIGIAGGFDN